MTQSLLCDGKETGMKLKIGVMGSASGEMKDEALQKAYNLGKAIADNDCMVVTGACPGFPYETARGVRENGGLVIGISPGLSLEEHMTKYNSPHQNCDVMVFTGSGLMGREISNIRTCDIVIIVGGRSGTLGEFSIAYDEGKLIGVLTGTGGVADGMHKIEEIIRKDTGTKIIYNDDPAMLVEEMIKEYKEHHYMQPCVWSTIDG